MDTSYPPSETVEFGQARDDRRAQLEAAAEDDESDIDADDIDSDPYLAALEWAVGEFGADASVELTALTAQSRARTLDTLNRTRVGEVGQQEARIWLTAAGIDRAPWDAGDGVAAQAQILGEALPPAFVDWLHEQLEGLNDLTEGN